MKISRKQQEEIDFYSRGFIPTEDEKEQYIHETVHGVKSVKEDWRGGNRIAEAKRHFEITIAMWREDLVNGLLSIDELYEDEDFGKYPYAKRLIDSVLKSLDFHKYEKGKGLAVISLHNAKRKHEICIS